MRPRADSYECASLVPGELAMTIGHAFEGGICSEDEVGLKL